MSFCTYKYQLDSLQGNDVKLMTLPDHRVIGTIVLDGILDDLINYHIETLKRLIYLFHIPGDGEKKFLDDPIAQIIIPAMQKPAKNTDNIANEYNIAIVDAYCWSYRLNYDVFAPQVL